MELFSEDNVPDEIRNFIKPDLSDLDASMLSDIEEVEMLRLNGRLNPKELTDIERTFKMKNELRKTRVLEEKSKIDSSETTTHLEITHTYIQTNG